MLQAKISPKIRDVLFWGLFQFPILISGLPSQLRFGGRLDDFEGHEGDVSSTM